MVVVRRPELEVDACTQCHGAWFDSGELELHLEQVLRLEAPRLEYEPGKRLHCPHCKEDLQAHVVGAAGEAIVEVCGRHGLFVRGGTLAGLNLWAKTMPLTMPPEGISQTKTSEVSNGGSSSTEDAGHEGWGLIAELLVVVLAALAD